MNPTSRVFKELAERREWRQWLAEFTTIVRRRIRDSGSNLNHRLDWREIPYLYYDGYNPERAATKYLEAHHLGENA